MSRNSGLTEMSIQEEKYTVHEKYRVFCGSFNVNGKLPEYEDISPWLFLLNDKPADIYAIGFQELVDLNTTSILMYTDYNSEQTWMTEIEARLSSNFAKKHFRLVNKCRLVGLFLVVYADEDLINQGITEVYVSSVATGI